MDYSCHMKLVMLTDPEGNEYTVNQAKEKYGVNLRTIFRWYKGYNSKKSNCYYPPHLGWTSKIVEIKSIRQEYLREYSVWTAMKRRCYQKQFISYPYYGAKGITVCKRWRESFENFISDMGPRPGKEYQIDRKDAKKNYTPKNCRWITKDENLGRVIKGKNNV